MESLAIVLSWMLAAGLGAGLAVWFLRERRPGKAPPTLAQVSLEGLRAVGELTVFRAITKEIVTETDYSFGEFGRKYLRWAFSQKKLAMIFEFQIDFKYDLKSPDFMVFDRRDTLGNEVTELRLPPVQAEISVRNLRFYDEQRSKFLPWLLPDLLNGAFGPGFSEEDKNRLLDGAVNHARAHAQQLIEQLRPEVEAAARTTLVPLARSLGVAAPRIAFAREVLEIDRTGEMRRLPEATGEGGNAKAFEPPA